MYTFPSKLRILAIAYMVLGLAGLVYGFLSAPKTIELKPQPLEFGRIA